MQLSDLDINKTYTYADYVQWTFEERLELIKGRIFKMSPAPNSIHQIISASLFNALYNHLKGNQYRVFYAPFDVRLTTRSIDDKDIITVVQPDICVICDRKKYDDKGGIGSPDIVVEILSPGNNKKELQNKYEVYEESGILEYWIIHPLLNTFLKYTLTNGQFQASKLLTIGDYVTTPILPGFVLSLDDLFEDKN